MNEMELLLGGRKKTVKSNPVELEEKTNVKEEQKFEISKKVQQVTGNDFLLAQNVANEQFWKAVKEADRGGYKNRDSLNALTISDFTEKIALKTEKKEPMKIHQPLRGSMWSKTCPRLEVIKHIKNHVEYEELTLKQLSIFDTGKSFERILREIYAEKGFIHGDWKCEKCGKKTITGDFVHDFGDGEKSYVTEKTPKKYGTKKPQSCESCGCVDFSYVELEVYSEELHITMHPDGLIFVDEAVKRYIPELRLGSWYVLEIKTSKDVYWKMTKDGPLTNQSGFEWNHPHQGLSYQYFFKANGVIYVYHNKNNHNTRFIIDERSDINVIDDLKRRGNSLRDGWCKLEKKGESFSFNDLPSYGICNNIKEARKKCKFAGFCFYGK